MSSTVKQKGRQENIFVAAKTISLYDSNILLLQYMYGNAPAKYQAVAF